MKQKIIPQEKKLIIFDLANTLLISNDRRVEPRKGSKELLDRLKPGRNIVVYSDSAEEKISSILRAVSYNHFYIRRYIDRVYGARSLIVHDRRKCKDLVRVCKEFKRKEEEAVMVGDSDIDEYSAEIAEIDYIIVPGFDKNPGYDLRILAPYWFSVSEKQNQ